MTIYAPVDQGLNEEHRHLLAEPEAVSSNSGNAPRSLSPLLIFNIHANFGTSTVRYSVGHPSTRLELESLGWNGWDRYGPPATPSRRHRYTPQDRASRRARPSSALLPPASRGYGRSRTTRGTGPR